MLEERSRRARSPTASSTSRKSASSTARSTHRCAPRPKARSPKYLLGPWSSGCTETHRRSGSARIPRAHRTTMTAERMSFSFALHARDLAVQLLVTRRLRPRRPVRYAVVTPAHNEAANLDRLHASLGAQSVPAERWVIVENGSTDETLRVASSLASREHWIDVRSIPGGTTSDRGAPIVRAIHEGVDVVGNGPEVIAVVDADVTFPAEYFEQLLMRFQDDERLGLASGTCFEEVRGEWRERHVTGDHVWGATPGRTGERSSRS